MLVSREKGYEGALLYYEQHSGEKGLRRHTSGFRLERASSLSVACWCSGISPLLSLSPGRVEIWTSKGHCQSNAQIELTEGYRWRMSAILR
jgi:hypothetical protein